MKERAQRFVFLFLLLSLFAVQWKSHGALPREVPMAFVRYTGSEVTVRVQGDVSHPGIYKFSDGDILMSAINMTAPKVFSSCADTRFSQQRIPNGTIIEIRGTSRNCAEITISTLSITEMILLGVPLHPDRLSFSEWESLPGIGPSLARTIINDRQENGAFGSLEALKRVPGVGDRKVFELIKYF